MMAVTPLFPARATGDKNAKISVHTHVGAGAFRTPEAFWPLQPGEGESQEE